MDENFKMKHRITFRYDDKIQVMIRWLMGFYKDKFQDESQLLRVSVINLYSQLKKELENEFKKIA